MKPRIVSDARYVALRAYSMWANYLGLACLLLPEILFAFWQLDTNPRLWWWLGLLLIIAGAIGRIIDQSDSTKVKGSVIPALLALLLIGMSQVRPEPDPQPAHSSSYTSTAPVSVAEFEAIGVPLIARWEGKRNTAYQDMVGVWTICYGHTRTARPGLSMTDAECMELLRSEVLVYRDGLHRYFTSQTRLSRLTPARDAAYVSLAYNVGVRGAGRSTAVRRLNAGDVVGGCEALTWWNKAGGRVVRGLVRRRSEERLLCLRGAQA